MAFKDKYVTKLAGCNFLCALLIVLSFTSCKKDWLEAKPNQALIVPDELNDLDALLNNSDIINVSKQPTLSEVGTDDYYITQETFDSRTQEEKNMYSWADTDNFYDGSDLNNINWDGPYHIIYYCNTVLEQVNKVPVTSGNIEQWSDIKGTALFTRAYSHFNIAQMYCKPFIEGSADTDAGIVLRLTSDIDIKLTRSTVEQTYASIIDDLMEAKSLLPSQVANKTRPGKRAAFAMLARVYLSMNKFAEAGLYADSSLAIGDGLIDYNTLDFANLFPFARFNDEVIYHTMMLNNRLLPTVFNASYVDSSLYASYHDKDIRKKAFFSELFGTLGFLGTYEGTFFFFTGLATDELYLIKAESLARNGETALAMEWLNKLLVKRFSTGEFTPLEAPDATSALAAILGERRKELCFRGLRWTDLRRLSQDPVFSVTLTKKIGEQIFILPPSDIDRYVYPIPQSEVLYNGIEQNKR